MSLTHRDKNGDEQLNASVIPVVLLAIAAIVLVIVVLCNIVTINAGEVGVRFDKFSQTQYYDEDAKAYKTTSVDADEYGEGIHIKAPWVKIDRYNTKLQQYTMVRTEGEGEIAGDDRVWGLSAEGLDVGIDSTVYYRLISAEADEMRRTIGREGDYQSIIRGIIRGTIRESIANFKAEEIYSAKRELFAAGLLTMLQDKLGSMYLLVDRVEIREVDIPDVLTEKIVMKQAAEQDALAMEFVLQKSVREKEKRIIEAEGIAEANKIIAGSIDKKYLAFEWLQKLENHESVVYLMGDGAIDSMQLFKDIDDPSGPGGDSSD